MNRLVVVMAKHPRPGHAKTRLIPRLGAAGAAKIAACMIRDTVNALHAREDCHVVIAIDSEESRPWFELEFPGTRLVLQRGIDLGARLDGVLREGLAAGYTTIFAIGSDSPDLPAEHLTLAFEALDDQKNDVVFGPSDDGGYYLVGWKRPWSAMLKEVEMSTSRVLADSMVIADRLDARVALGPWWYDVDEPADLDRLRERVDSTEGSSTTGFLAHLHAQP